MDKKATSSNRCSDVDAGAKEPVPASVHSPRCYELAWMKANAPHLNFTFAVSGTTDCDVCNQGK